MKKLKIAASNHDYRSLAWVALACLFAVLLPFSTRSQSLSSAPNLLPGQSATRLADGKLLLVGGESAAGGLHTVSIWDPATGNSTPISATLNHGRAWHTATVLPDGLILIIGGLGNNKQVVSTVELYDPATQTITILPSTGVTPRARHTVTLLTDGHVLIAGGVGTNGQTLKSAELWDALDPSSSELPVLSTARRNHSATLLPDGKVLLWGGTDNSGNPLTTGDLFDPVPQLFTSLQSFPTDLLPLASDSPSLVATIPLDRSTDVPTESVISLRFSKPLKVETVNSNTVTLQGPKGIEKIKVVGAENGSLAFITPDDHLLPGSTYSLTINGAVDRDGLSLAVTGLTFTTQPLPGGVTPGSKPTPAPGGSKVLPPAPADGSALSADGDLIWTGKLKDGKPHSDWEDLPPLKAADGVTALAGQVLDLKGMPLANVKLEIEGEYGQASVSSQTDDTGRFLLSNIQTGRRELIIDGRVAQRRVSEQSSALGPKENHGVFEYGHEVKEGETTVLPFTIWLPKIDSAHAVNIPQHLTNEVVVTSPKLAGLEVHLPANAEVIDRDGKPVTEVSLTRIPLDRTPFPLAKNVRVPIYFTAQPGGAYIHNPGGIGARIYYPNTFNELPGTKFEFWHYDPEYKGWYKYGLGTVPPDGKQVIPDPGISVHEFTGAMVGGPGLAAAIGAAICTVVPMFCEGGDPVNLATGLFVVKKTDLYLADGVMPISLTRTYRQSDTVSRAFGIGASHSFDMFLVGDITPYTYIDLILADGSRVHYDRISAGTGFSDAVYEHVSTQSEFYKSRITWNDANVGWDLRLKNGTLFEFPESAFVGRPEGAAVRGITMRNGSQITLIRDSARKLTGILSPSGHSIDFTYDGFSRITQAKDDIGRTVNYEYDATGRLIKVTDPNGGFTEYTYDTSSRMLTVKDARGIVYITNEYDATGKVIKQTMIDGGIYLFNYTTSGSTVTQTDITDPRGNLRRVTFNTAGQILTHTNAVGTADEQVTTHNIQSGTNFVLSEVDPLNRTTSYTYDSMGNTTSVTRLSGTAGAVTTTFTYEPTFNQLNTVTDPVNHTTAYGYDAKGNLISVTNALGQTTSIGRNSAGQPIAVIDPLNNTSLLAYEFGDLSATTDALGNITTRFTDNAGRVLGVTDPRGNLNIYDYDVLNRRTKVTDPINGATNFSYDPNGNLLNVTDARNNATIYTYDNMDRLATRRDPLLRTETHQYDLNGNRSQVTDRKSQVATYSYDSLDRRTGVTYADTSTTGFTFDKGNWLTQVNDSIAGTITRTYDGLNRLTSESTLQGSVSYTYDAAGRRATMTVGGQSSVLYSYDNANRLTQITQGVAIVSYTYDAAGRRTSLTFPNGVLVEYAYDGASRLTGITYKQNGTTVLGNLTYEYDKNGNRTKTGGSFARTGVPPAVASTAYNAANHQTTFGDKTLTYDNNGNLQTMTDPSGTTTYTWNARNQLTGISGPGMSASFVYDGLGRREKKTINGNLTEFLYDGLNPVQETSGATILANILPGLGIDEFLTRTDVVAGVTSSFLTDALGSSVAVTDNAGVVQTEYTYEPFGKTTFSGTSNSSSYQYTGRENDGTGAYYYRNRYYHPQLQRFISEDPIALEGGDINFFAYVINNPIKYFDPIGLEFLLGRVPPYARINQAWRQLENTARNANELPRESGPPKPTPANEPAPTPDKLGWPNSGQAEGHAPHEVEHGGCLTPFGCGGGGHGGIISPTTPPGGGRKDPPPFPGCNLGLCPDPRA